MPIKAIFFDYDGVLTLDRTGSLTTNRFLSEQTGIAYDRVRRAFGRHNREMNEGSTSYVEVWPAVCADLEFDVPIELLDKAFESTPLNDAMLRLARDLKARYRVGIISDNKKDRMDHLRRFQRLWEVFDPIVVSANIGGTKADSRIFQAALLHAGVDAHEAVLIDNEPSNFLAASALGMKTVWFDDTRNDVARLARRLAIDLGA